MVSQTRTLNSIQKVVKQSISGTKVDGGTVLKAFYTVPTGKKTLVTSIQIAPVSLGTGTEIDIKVNNTQLKGFTAISQALSESLPNEIVLTAGQQIQYGGNAAGNNETINFYITYQETPA